MEVSVIYDLLVANKLHPYRNKLENEDNNLSNSVKEDRKKLEDALSEEQLQLLKHFLGSLKIFEGYVDFQVEVRALNFGIKIGAQLQKSIRDLYNYFDEENDYE